MEEAKGKGLATASPSVGGQRARGNAGRFSYHWSSYLLSGKRNNPRDLLLLTNQLEHFLVARMVAQRIEIGVVLDPGFSLVIGVREQAFQ